MHGAVEFIGALIVISTSRLIKILLFNWHSYFSCLLLQMKVTCWSLAGLTVVSTSTAWRRCDRSTPDCAPPPPVTRPSPSWCAPYWPRRTASCATFAWRCSTTCWSRATWPTAATTTTTAATWTSASNSCSPVTTQRRTSTERSIHILTQFVGWLIGCPWDWRQLCLRPTEGSTAGCQKDSSIYSTWSQVC